jgi:hypothetical protein
MCDYTVDQEAGVEVGLGYLNTGGKDKMSRARSPGGTQMGTAGNCGAGYIDPGFKAETE